MATTDASAGSPVQSHTKALEPVRRHRRYARLAVAVIMLTGLFGLFRATSSASATTTEPQTAVLCATGATPDLRSRVSISSLPAGTYSSVVVDGNCKVNEGHVVVTGDVTIRSGDALIAAYAKNDSGSGTSGITVDGNIAIASGGSLLLGCEAAHFACLDDPNHSHPTLNASETVDGSVVATDALGVVIHASTVGGDVIQSGGGGGNTCTPTGIFAKFGSPVYSDYEDNTIGGNVRVTGLNSCWAGVLRNKIGGSTTFSNNSLVDPDADELMTNTVSGNLLCADDTPEIQYGDSHGSPNVVGGYGSGQCSFSAMQPNPAPVAGAGGNKAGPLAHISKPTATSPGYWLTAGDGGVFSFGEPFFGSQAGIIGQPVVGIAGVPGGGGYDLAGNEGAVYRQGQHALDCSGLTVLPNQPVVGIATAPGGNGCWLAAGDGGVFSFGPNAPFFGSAGDLNLTQPIVGIAAAPNNDGYYLVASDGGVFAYGPGAIFHGSMGGQHLNQPIVGMAVDPSTGGYWLVASDGGVFSFDAPFIGSMGGSQLNKPVVGMAASPTGNGYYLVASDGGIFAFGPGAPFEGSTGSLQLNEPVVGMTLGPASAPALSIKITLDQTRVTAGQTIKGTALITNSTAVPITVEACAADGWLDVGLTNGTITYDPTSSAVACASTVQLAPGVNRIPISVMTTFQSCVQPGGGPTSVNNPPCTQGAIPALPPGDYTTEVATMGLPADTPTPVPVAVTLLPKLVASVTLS
jgi:hypothetical protein